MHDKNITIKEMIKVIFKKEFYLDMAVFVFICMPVVLLLLVLALKVDKYFGFRPFIGSPYNIIAFFIFFISGGLIVWEAYTYLVFIGKGSPSPQLGGTAKLVTCGPYALVRHPSVIGKFFGVLGVGCLFKATFFTFAIIPLMFIISAFYNRFIQEEGCVKKFGDEYLQYRKNVPMLIPNSRMSNRIIFVIFAILLGVVLRGLFFNHSSLWSDEALSVYYASNYALEIPAKLALSVDDLHPPFYYLLLHFWMYVGKTEFILRLFSALFSVLTIWVIYLVGEKLADYKVGIVSAFIFALSPFNIYNSGEIRNYTLLCFLSLLSVYFFLRILEKNTDRWPMPLYIISTSLCMYTHNCGIFVPLIENIFVFACFKRYKMLIKSWIPAQLLIWLLYLPWFFVLLYQISRLTAQESSLFMVISNIFRQHGRPHSEALSIVDMLLNYSSFCYPPYIKIWMIIVFGFLFLRGLFFFKKKPVNMFFLLLYLFSPIVLFHFLIQPFYAKYILKYFIAFAPAYYIFLSVGLVSLRETRNKFIGAVLFYFMFANIITINFSSLYNTQQRILREDWRTLSNYVTGKASPTDIILFDRGKMMPAFEYYFKSDIPRIGFIAPKPSGEKDIEYERYVAQVMEIIAKKYDRIWIICDIRNRRINFTQEVVEKYFVLEEKLDFGIHLLLYKNREGVVPYTAEMIVNPCKLQRNIACGKSIIQQIDFPETATYVFFIPAQSLDTFPFYSNMKLALDGQILAFYEVKAKYPMFYKAEAFVSKGSHLVKVEFVEDKYRFNKKRRLFLGEVMCLK